MGMLSIALNTFRGFSRDRIFHATMLFSIALVGFAYALSTLTIVETQKILLDFGFSAISLSGILIAVFLGISSVAKELETKIIYTILAKPIPRYAYVLGKYWGCSMVLVIVHAIIAGTLGLIVGVMSTGLPDGYLACNFLMLLESLLLLSVALFASIFSSTILASSFTVGLFLIGRSAHYFGTLSARSENSAEKYLFDFLYYLFPNLDRFNIREVTAYAKPYPDGMIWQSSLYFVGYAAVFLVLSAFLFARRDMP